MGKSKWDSWLVDYSLVEMLRPFFILLTVINKIGLLSVCPAWQLLQLRELARIKNVHLKNSYAWDPAFSDLGLSDTGLCDVGLLSGLLVGEACNKDRNIRCKCRSVTHMVFWCESCSLRITKNQRTDIIIWYFGVSCLPF